MIVGSQKSFDEIWEMIKGFKDIIVLGCNTCVAVCHAGGGKEAEKLSTMVKIKANELSVSMNVTSLSVMRQCENEYIDEVIDNLKKSQLVLSMACGVGVNFLSQKIGAVPVFPALNTSFYGGVPKEGLFVELCAGCGNCILHLTGGICPIARCSKSLLNGPCGGTDRGKCEVSKDIDCAWYLIVERMKLLGTLEKLYEVQPPRDWSSSFHGGPRRVSIDHITAYEEQHQEGK
ncbi:MAG: methylenetetrahydrofolate reductase C-terminal domain-containing protein [Thermodesulfovibrionales bacterium]|nr:methylenetetrahydrofolate reductase C-terminal domain-containing protein [Thermodesulfovibrionales bacterium]